MKVSFILDDEIDDLSSVADSFDQRSDQESVDVYKQKLRAHVENRLIQNLTLRCSDDIRRKLEDFYDNMKERLSIVLPEEARQQIQAVIPKTNFEITWQHENLFADFIQDNSFHFLVRPSDILPILRRDRERNVPTPFKDIAVVAGGSAVLIPAMTWQISAFVTAAYGLMYMGKKWIWSKNTKMRFKKQYVDFVSCQLRMKMNEISTNFSYQVRMELESTWSRLYEPACASTTKLEKKIKQKDCNISQLHDYSSKAEYFSNKADELDKALDAFKELF